MFSVYHCCHAVHTIALLCDRLTCQNSNAQEDAKALGGLAPVGYIAGVAGFELLPILAPRPFSSVSGLLFGVLRLRLWLSLLAGLVFGPLQVTAPCVFQRARAHAQPSCSASLCTRRCAGL